MKTHRVVTMLRFIALTAVAGNLPQAAAESIVIRDTLVVEALRVPIELDRAP
ncbi:uncharacterized protein METZ01_LOCUS477748, partial [marine metagenome]